MNFFKKYYSFDSYPIKVDFVKLTHLEPSQQEQFIKQAGLWATKNWQYIFPTITDWEADVRKFQENFYFAIYAGQPVGMFALKVLDEYQAFRRPLMVQTLFYVYVDERVRSLSVGKQITKEAERIAREQGMDMVVLQTTKPSLNSFYQKNGYRCVCDSQFYGQTVSNLMLSLS